VDSHARVHPALPPPLLLSCPAGELPQAQGRQLRCLAASSPPEACCLLPDGPCAVAGARCLPHPAAAAVLERELVREAAACCACSTLALRTQCPVPGLQPYTRATTWVTTLSPTAPHWRAEPEEPGGDAARAAGRGRGRGRARRRAAASGRRRGAPASAPAPPRAPAPLTRVHQGPSWRVCNWDCPPFAVGTRAAADGAAVSPRKVLCCFEVLRRRKVSCRTASSAAWQDRTPVTGRACAGAPRRGGPADGERVGHGRRRGGARALGRLVGPAIHVPVGALCQGAPPAAHTVTETLLQQCTTCSPIRCLSGKHARATDTSAL